MKKYREGSFQQALSLFTETNELMKEVADVEEDKCCTLMMKRCEAYIVNPPPQGWEGIWEGPT